MPHIHEKVDFTAEVFVVYKDRVLLRKHDKYGVWISVGGHVELSEDPNQAAIREVKEEVGLDITLVDTRTTKTLSKDYKELIPPAFLNRHRINDTHEHVTMTYFAVADSDKVTNSSAEVAEDLKWLSASELDDPEYALPEHVRHYARTALEVAAAERFD
jgi:8-oxo-dGTP pyrophosphatase MutT (NUDIX family)